MFSETDKCHETTKLMYEHWSRLVLDVSDGFVFYRLVFCRAPLNISN